MSRRWFLSSVTIGAAAAAKTVTGARATYRPGVEVVRTLTGQPEDAPRSLDGPTLELLGPGDTLGFEQAQVIRREPAPGTLGTANHLALIEFADAALPWLFSLPTPRRMPWLTLLVLRKGEGQLTPGNPLPVVDVPAAALPDLLDAASWVHVEARVEGDGPPADAVTRDVRTGLDTVVSRLICPRKLEPNAEWIACVVPTTKAGVAAGLGEARPADGAQPAWTAGQPAVRLPVYDSWEFGTAPEGSFEDLARRIRPADPSELPADFGVRTIDVRRPWPQEPPPAGAPDTVTLKVQGALRLPHGDVAEEQWSDPAAMHAFREVLRTRLDAPAARRTEFDAAPDRDREAVAPPLYGSRHTGVQRVPDRGWMAALNTEVRFRVAAALGARYVQLEQEFLMARAWEQVGEITEANRLLAATELAEFAADLAKAKHLTSMAPAAMTELADVLHAENDATGEHLLRATLAQSAVPDGAGSTSFARLTRTGGALARRCARAAGVSDGMPAGSVLATAITGQEVVAAKPALWYAATAETAMTTPRPDPAATFATQTLLGLVGGQQESFTLRSAFVGDAPAQSLAAISATMSETMAGGAPQLPLPVTLRGLRRAMLAEKLTVPRPVEFAMQTGIEDLASSVRSAIQPLALQLTRLSQVLPHLAAAERAEQARPLRPIMRHPEFGFPIGAEILQRWPEWALPGITSFPDNTATLLETNSAFVEALLVGLNQEFNRELRWREYPTDEAGTPFSRFWPPGGAQPQYGEIARWDPETSLGDNNTEFRDLLVLLVRADVLRRYPGTVVLAAQSRDRKVERADVVWRDPKFVLPVDEQTTLYGFDLDEPTVRAQDWMFVVREPMRGTQFGFDVSSTEPYLTWSDLGWDRVRTENGFVVARPANSPQVPGTPDPAAWPGADPADFARIIFQRPFQVAFSPTRMLGTGQE